MDIIPILTSIILGYFTGNLMASYFVAKWVIGADIRDHGTGNAGGSNSIMIMGWKNGLIVAVIDVLKAFLAVYFIKILYHSEPNISLLILISGSMSIVGHIFPFFMNFKGGKGAASFIGMCLAINPMIGLYIIIGCFFITLITDYVAVSSICAYLFLPFFLVFYPDVFFMIPGLSFDFGYMIISIFVAIIGIYKHRVNIINIINGKEKGLRSVVFKKSS
ncbi:MAG: hypothetical protein CBD97_01030 [Pelagibacteraceae bacterium TMED237]|nr:hypothetical protein [Candidatus Neomarinimicrobiota bacterium]OUW96649.1 MAG: hypothetical protein CBD97_01030 [Pelagibacteraceae bacterium TMED237]